MALEEPTEEDIIEKVEGINFIIEKDFKDSFGQVNIDYGNGIFKKGFQITTNYAGGGSCS